MVDTAELSNQDLDVVVSDDGLVIRTTIDHPEGEMADSNAELVGQAAEMLRGVGREPATPESPRDTGTMNTLETGGPTR